MIKKNTQIENQIYERVGPHGLAISTDFEWNNLKLKIFSSNRTHSKILSLFPGHKSK